MRPLATQRNATQGPLGRVIVEPQAAIVEASDEGGPERLAEVGIEPSVGRIGDSYDNARADTITVLYKAEMIDRRAPWRRFEASEFATREGVDWFQ